MFRNTAGFGLLLLSGSLLAGGCTASSADDDTNYYVTTPTAAPTPKPTPTPTATATPTADPHAGYRMASLTLEEDDGVDLDGNGKVDNDYAETLTAVSKSISSGFQGACETALEGVELPEQVPTDNTTLLCKSISTALTQALSGLVSVDDFNNNVVEAMASVEYLERAVVPAPGNLALSYYWGTGGGSYTVGDLISTHTGAVDASGKGKLGPGQFSAVLLLGNGEGTLVYMNLVKSRTELVYLDGSVGSPKVGGVLTEDALVDTLIQSVAGTVPLPEEILSKVADVIAGIIPDCGEKDTSMEDCNSSLGGITMGFSYTLETVSLE